MSELSIEFNINKHIPIIKFKTTGDYDGVSIEDRTSRIDVQEILAKISQIKIPKQNKIVSGCDGSAWEIQIDDKVLKGYLDNPNWLKQIQEIIKFKDIHSYAERKLEAYLNTKI